MAASLALIPHVIPFALLQARLNSSESAPLLTRLYSVVSSLNRSTYTSGSDGAIFGVALRTLEQAPSKVLR